MFFRVASDWKHPKVNVPVIPSGSMKPILFAMDDKIKIH